MRRMNPQAVLNKTWKHLRQQGEKCQSSDGACLYRGEGGRMCAIGAIIPDDIYYKGIEHYPVEELVDPELGRRYGKEYYETRFLDFSAKFRDMFTKNVTADFLRQIQEVHDCYPVDEWDKQFRKLAESNGLMSLK